MVPNQAWSFKLFLVQNMNITARTLLNFITVPLEYKKTINYFETRTIYGSNTLDLHVKEPTDKLVLDSWDLDIFKVEIVKPGSAQFATDK